MVEIPVPGPGQVLIGAQAVALNNADLSAFGGTEPYLAGYEVAGHVESSGQGVGIPDGLSPSDAAALPTALLTEHGALQAGGFSACQSVLITGATSSIGLVGLQIAREFGAGRILATTRSAEHTAVLDATEGDGADLVLDHVGEGVFADCLPATKVDGPLVNIGRLGGSTSTIDLDSLSYRHLSIGGVSFGFTRAEELGQVITDAGTALTDALAAGRVRPVVDFIMPFADAPAAANRLRSGEDLGKVVLSLD